MQALLEVFRGFDVVLVVVLVSFIFYQQRKIVRLEAQVDLLVELQTDQSDDPNGRGVVIDRLRALRRPR